MLYRAHQLPCGLHQKHDETNERETGDPDFVYEISCDQMCGKGHFGMRGEIIVETQEEYDRWIISQKPQYSLAHPEASPPKAQPADTTKVAAVVLKN